MGIKKVISILLFILSIAMIGSGVYIMNSNKYMFESALDGVFDYLVDGYVEMSNASKNLADINKYKLTTSTSFKQNNNELASLNGDIYVNGIDKKAYIDLVSKVNGEDFVGLEVLLSNDKLYAKIKEVMNEFYYNDLTSYTESTSNAENLEYSQLLKLEKNELELLTKHLKNSILKDLKDSDFSKSSETLTLDNKNYKTNKITLNISKKRLGTIVENLLTYISKDNKAIQILQKFDKTITKDSIQKSLESLKEQSSSFSDEEQLNFSFYIESFTSLRRIELSTSNNEVDSIATGNESFTLDIYNNSYKNKTYLLTIIDNDATTMTIKEEYTDSDKANLIIKYDDYEINGTISSTNSAQEFNLNLLSSGQNIGTINYKYTVVGKNKEYKLDLSILLSDQSIEIVSNNTILLNEEIPNLDVENAKDFNEMTEEEQSKLSDFFNEKLEEVGLSNNDSLEEEDNNEI